MVFHDILLSKKVLIYSEVCQNTLTTENIYITEKACLNIQWFYQKRLTVMLQDKTENNKIIISLVFIIQSYFAVLKNIRLNSTH